MKDLIEIIEAVTRRVEKRDLDGKAACATILESVYETDATDLWDALTNKDRLPRWFAPVDGDFKLGGQFQIKGNAGGEITYCEAEKGFDLTWEYGSDVSWLKVRIKPENNKTHLYIEHLAHSEGEHFETYGPGATGVGWDLSMLGLGYYLQTTQSIDNDVFMDTPDAKNIISLCAKDWGDAAFKAGFDQHAAITSACNTEKFYLGEA